MYLKELYINKEAWTDINRHAVEGGSNEIGGFLMGFRCMLDSHPMTWITKSVRGICTSSPAHVIIETSTYDRVLTVMEAEDLSIVGWYHTHPKLGVFLSPTDRDTMSLHFNDPSSIALVLDPKMDTWAFFGWDEERRRLKRLDAYLFDGPNYKQYIL
jgi:proteasome lid subunit RPN8/RPN11